MEILLEKVASKEIFSAWLEVSNTLNQRIVKKHVPGLKNQAINMAPVLGFMKPKSLIEYQKGRRCLMIAALAESMRVKKKDPEILEKEMYKVAAPINGKVDSSDLPVIKDFTSYEFVNVLEYLKLKYSYEKEEEGDFMGNLTIEEDGYTKTIKGEITFASQKVFTIFRLKKNTDHLKIIKDVEKHDYTRLIKK